VRSESDIIDAVNSNSSGSGSGHFPTAVRRNSLDGASTAAAAAIAASRLEKQTSVPVIKYVQGMNVTLAPFLFVMPEADAFFAYARFIQVHCPRYVLKNMDGCYKGCEILERIVRCIDPELYAHLIGRRLTFVLFAFPAVCTMMASMKPLEEVLRMWDAMLAFGVHLSLVMYACHIVLMRDDLLREQSAAK
jgi:cell cycle arrest protein BUB2